MFKPKQLPHVHYQIDVNIEDVKHQIERYDTSQKRFGYQLKLNSEFQRGHVWSTDQQVKFLEWVLSGGYSGIILFNHSRWQTDYEDDMYCVDGLQRLTAVCDFIDGKIKPFGYTIDEYDGGFLPFVKFGIGSVSYPEMLQWYIDLNSGGTPHTREEIEKVKKLLDGVKS